MIRAKMPPEGSELYEKLKRDLEKAKQKAKERDVMNKASGLKIGETVYFIDEGIVFSGEIIGVGLDKVVLDSHHNSLAFEHIELDKIYNSLSAAIKALEESHEH